MLSVIYSFISVLSPNLNTINNDNAIHFSDKWKQLVEIISKKHDLSRKRITIFHITNHPQVLRVAHKLDIGYVILNYNASSNTVKIVTASSSEMQEQITNQQDIITH
jgi:carboxylesterase type B